MFKVMIMVYSSENKLLGNYETSGKNESKDQAMEEAKNLVLDVAESFPIDAKYEFVVVPLSN